MTVSNNLSPLSASQLQETLGRSLSRLAANAKSATTLGDTSSVTDASAADYQNAQVATARAGVQNAASLVQARASGLETMTGLVSRLGELAKLAQNPSAKAEDVAKYQTEFQSGQDQLRAVVGSGAQGATFGGQPLFGAAPEGGNTLTLTNGKELSLSDLNLRQGGIGALISQNSSGQYGASVVDADVGSTIAQAMGQLRAGQAGTVSDQRHLEIAAATLEVENQNLNSAFPAIKNLADAFAYTSSAKNDVFANFASALQAQGNVSGQSVLKTLAD